MAKVNEFILICTFHFIRIRGRNQDEFGVNRSAFRFNHFKSRVKFQSIKPFPAKEKEKLPGQKVLSEHLTTVRRFGRGNYVAAGCLFNRNVAAEIDAKTTEVIRAVIPGTGTIHNFVMYKDVLLLADLSHKLRISGLDTAQDKVLHIESHVLNSNTPGSHGLTCGKHMEIDGRYAYVVCSLNQLVRIDLRHVDPSDPKASESKVTITEIFKSAGAVPCFYIGKKYILVFAGNNFTRINKQTLTQTELKKTGAAVNVNSMVGSDSLAFVATDSDLKLFTVTSTSNTLLDSAQSKLSTGNKTRMLIPGVFRGVSFVVRLFESPVVVSMFAALKNKLHLILEHKVDSGSRALGGMYDSITERIIISLESFQSRCMTLSY